MEERAPADQFLVSVFNLPDDIFVEILSHFAAFKVHELYYRVDQQWEAVMPMQHLPREYAARRQMLFTLTQVCRGMREKFTPWLLEHIQSLFVYIGYESDKKKQEHRQLVKKSLLRQMKMLAASPSLAAHVR